MYYYDVWKNYLIEADANMPSTTAAPIAQPSTTSTQQTAQTSPPQDAKAEQDAAKKKQDAQKALVDLNTALKAIQTQAANLQQLLAEKKRAKVVKKNKSGGDRCTRIAKRKYDVWPSAYASGAVVKCRQGKIWKGISESATDEEIDDALLLEEIEVIEEEWSDKYKRSIDCKNPKGFSQKAHCQGKKKK